MPEILYNQLISHLNRTPSQGVDSAYLVFGDGFLVEQAASSIVDRLLPDPADKSVHLETVDLAEGESIYALIEQINTISFFAPRKVVRVKADILFASGFQPEKHLERIEEARLSNDIHSAARLLAELAARLQVETSDISEGDPEKVLKMDPRPHTDIGWLKQAAAYGIEKGISPAGGTGAAAILKEALQKGFPKGHVLLLTAGTVDRRSALYKAINAAHTVINCSVPTGSRKAEVDQQKQVLTGLMQHLLATHQKSADSKVFDRVFHLTGFSPRVFSANIEKLIQYAGASPHIRNEDVAAVLDKTREDPVFVFTGALFEKNAPKAIQCLSSLLFSGFHYMQLLNAVVNQVRKLLMIRFFTESPHGKAWQPGMGFDPFKKQVMPAVVKYDQELAAAEDGREALGAESKKGKKTAGKKARASDLGIVKNPNNPYPVYQLFLQAERFGTDGLKDFLVRLHEADIRLKTTGRSPKAVLEEMILHICIANDRP